MPSPPKVVLPYGAVEMWLKKMLPTFFLCPANAVILLCVPRTLNTIWYSVLSWRNVKAKTVLVTVLV